MDNVLYLLRFSNISIAVYYVKSTHTRDLLLSIGSDVHCFSVFSVCFYVGVCELTRGNIMCIFFSSIERWRCIAAGLLGSNAAFCRNW